jgi:hypothetical protein
MSRVATYTELRKHSRAQLALPVRIRWRGPLGMRLEITDTIDASREGFLVHRAEPCAVRARVWVLFPFDPAADALVQPEIPARVVRVENCSSGGFRVALHLELPPRQAPQPPETERRSSTRMTMALPIFVRAADSPFPEESMTQDISRDGALFETAHIYSPHEPVLARIPWGEWTRGRELPGHIVRIEEMDDLPRPARFSGAKLGASASLTKVVVRWGEPSKS